jgi:hypothetical protein
MNSSIIHADIFFYVTTISVVILTALLIVLFYYIVKIARHLERTALRLREESERIIEDVSMIRESIEDQGGRAVSFLKFIFGSFMRSGGSRGGERNGSKKSSRVKNRKKVAEEDEE